MEGRNGHLALKHHALHQFTTRKLQALTVLHNYVMWRADGTTAAERFYGAAPRDCFTWLLDRLAVPARPRAGRRARVTPTADLVFRTREGPAGSRADDARSLLRDLFTRTADIIPDERSGTLTVRVHASSNPRHDRAIDHLLKQVTAAEHTYPGTTLKLTYALAGALPDSNPGS